MKKKWLVLCFGLLLFISISLITYQSLVKKNISHIELKGEKIITLALNEEFIEPGFTAYDELGNKINDQVSISTPDLSKIGTHLVNYELINRYGEKVLETRFVIVNEEYPNEYDKIDNTPKEWWSNNKSDHLRPTGAYDDTILRKYHATFMGPNEKVIYLTFDEGSNDTYVKEISEVLNSNEVKGTFFFCKNFIVHNQNLMKSLVQNGHSVGNHTVSHKQMSTLATKENYSKFLAEIKGIEDAFKNVTGEFLDKVYREPKGEWSLRSLKIMQDLGYKTFFYSADYLDWNGDVSKEKALQELEKRVHNGAIYLIHPKNKGNYLALDTFIKDMKKEGYTFDLVKNINFS